MDTQDLREVLGEQERFAPEQQGVLRELARLRRSDGGGRLRHAWLAGMLAAAAVVAIIVGLTGLASRPDSLPGGPTPAATSTPSTFTSRQTVTTASTAELPVQSRERQLSEQAARDAAVSADQAAQAAANGARAAMTTCSRAASVSVLTGGEADDRKVTAAANACARAFGARPGYRVEWVESTLGSVQTLVTGHREGGDRAVVAVQVDGTFARAGQSAEHETMLLLVFLDGGSPTGVDAPTNPIELSTLGVVHRN
ncbi:hypothetical protein ABIB25_003353 [Nakamurella sp. UYEF19]|uniref:hypothetical protein n=1 Tax=Nakamurella sp. UYEF19 TaxID=1756392 RepID=UPI003399440F